MKIFNTMLLAVIVLILLTAAAWADNKGLFWSSTTIADGVTVRRLEDTSHNVVCYVAHGSYWSAETHGVSIACLQVSR